MGRSATEKNLHQETTFNITEKLFHTLAVLLAGWLSRYSDWLWDGRSGDRILVEARFSAPVQNGPGDHPSFCTMGTGSFPRVKRPGRDADPSPVTIAVVMKE